MTNELLGFIDSGLTGLGLNYEFVEWTSDTIPDIYWVGEYQESPPETEDGSQEITFILTGTGRTSWLDLENEKNKIKGLYNKVYGKRAILSNGDGVAIFYANSFIVPLESDEFKRLQINLMIKEWSVN